MLLDNCAGTGGPALTLASSLGLKPVLIEPNFSRFKECAARAPDTFFGVAEKIVSVGAPSVWYFNPPFDALDKRGRMERSILNSSTSYALGKNTLCIWVLPRRMLQDEGFIRYLNIHFYKVRIRRFPHRFYKEFGQVVLMMYSRETARGAPLNLIGNAKCSNGAISHFVELRKDEFQYAVPAARSFRIIGGAIRS